VVVAGVSDAGDASVAPSSMRDPHELFRSSMTNPMTPMDLMKQWCAR
jgi:hypothetical protein